MSLRAEERQRGTVQAKGVAAVVLASSQEREPSTE